MVTREENKNVGIQFNDNKIVEELQNFVHPRVVTDRGDKMGQEMNDMVQFLY